MRLAIAELEKYGAGIEESREGFSIVCADGKKIGIFATPPNPALLEIADPANVPMPAYAAQQAIKTYVAFDANRRAISRNDDISPVGKERRLQPVREEAIKTLVGVVRSFDYHDRQVQQMEVSRYVLPERSPGNFIRQLEDMEIRQRIHAMSKDEFNQLGRALNDGEEGAAVLMEAVLRSPLKDIGRLEGFARNGWKKLIDARDPDGIEIIQQQMAQIEWAKRITGPFQTMLIKELGFDRHQLFGYVDMCPELFGFEADEVKMIKLQKAQRGLRAS